MMIFGKKTTWKLDNSELEKLCAKTMNKVDLFRGMKNIPGTSGIIEVTRRTPVNSSGEYHALMDWAFNIVFGIKLRSFSFFCTGDIMEASKYGTVYNVFPSDDFTVYWSPFIKDLFGLNLSEENLRKKEFIPLVAVNILLAGEPMLRSTKLVNHLLSSKPFIKEFLEQEFPDYLLDYPRSAMATSGKILEKYLDTIKYLYKKGNMLDDLQEAANSGNEVMIDSKFYCWRLI